MGTLKWNEHTKTRYRGQLMKGRHACNGMVIPWVEVLLSCRQMVAEPKVSIRNWRLHKPSNLLFPPKHPFWGCLPARESPFWEKGVWGIRGFWYRGFEQERSIGKIRKIINVFLTWEIHFFRKGIFGDFIRFGFEKKGGWKSPFWGGVFRPVFGRFLRANFSRFLGLKFLSWYKGNYFRTEIGALVCF